MQGPERIVSDEPSGKRKVTQKSAAAFRTISEVAQELELQQHVLRFWETKFSQVTPMKRNGGRRYYRPDDIALLRRIRDLLHNEGYTIKGVQKLLSGEGRAAGDEGGSRRKRGPLPSQTPNADTPAELRGIIAELDDLRSLLTRALDTSN